jgi:hypothetical protein
MTVQAEMFPDWFFLDLNGGSGGCLFFGGHPFPQHIVLSKAYN